MKKWTIVLVDDEKNVLDSMERTLRSQEYEIIKCENGNQALEIFHTKSKEVDVVICDNRMPGIKGYDLLTELSGYYPDTVRIMLTGEMSFDTAAKAINQGRVFRLLKKPCEADEIRLVVRQALIQRDLWKENKRLFAEVKELRSRIAELESKEGKAEKAMTGDASSETLDEFMKKYFK